MAAGAVLAGVSAGMDVFSGLMGYVTSKFGAAVQESQGRMLRLEAEVEAQRYREQAESFQAEQSVAFTKSGVKLEGSPLTILDETILVASEHISAIRARGRAQELDFYNQATATRNKGRAALIGGVLKGATSLASLGMKTPKAPGTAAKASASRTGFPGYDPFSYNTSRVHRGIPSQARPL